VQNIVLRTRNDSEAAARNHLVASDDSLMQAFYRFRPEIVVSATSVAAPSLIICVHKSSIAYAINFNSISGASLRLYY
jgi:hypothetical protein